MNKLPTNLKTENNNTFGQTINTNFSSLENLYQELKYAFGGLNFIQLYGEVPYKERSASGTLAETNMFITGYELDYSAFETTVPGTTYLALKNIHDLQKELGNNVGEAADDNTRWLPMGTFIVSTNDGWRSYNPVYTTHIYQPSTLVCESYNPDTSQYIMKYTYKQVPISSVSISKPITTVYIDTTQTNTIKEKDIVINQEKIVEIPLEFGYPTSGVNVRLIDPNGESSLITYEDKGIKEIEGEAKHCIEVKFFPVTSGNYTICIDYGLRPEGRTDTTTNTYTKLYVTNPDISDDSVLNKLAIETLISNSNFINDDKLLNYYTKVDTNNKIQELTWTYATKTELNLKVDKEEGKGLSTNDFTDEDKKRLNSLNNYDDSEIRILIEDKANRNELFTKKYNDLIEKPEIPTKTSDLTNDSGFITADYVGNVDLTGYATESFVTDALKNYQPTINLDNYYTKEQSKKNFSQVYVTNEDGATWITVYNDNVTNKYSINAATFGWKVPSYYAAATDLNNKANSGDVYNKSEVDALISNVEVDSSDYYTKEEIENKKYLTSSNLTGYATEQYVDTQINQYKPDLSDYYTKTDIDNKEYLTSSDLTGKADVIYVDKQVADVNTKIASVSGRVGLVEATVVQLDSETSSFKQKIEDFSDNVLWYDYIYSWTGTGITDEQLSTTTELYINTELPSEEVELILSKYLKVEKPEDTRTIRILNSSNSPVCFLSYGATRSYSIVLSLTGGQQETVYSNRHWNSTRDIVLSVPNGLKKSEDVYNSSTQTLSFSLSCFAPLLSSTPFIKNDNNSGAKIYQLTNQNLGAEMKLADYYTKEEIDNRKIDYTGIVGYQNTQDEWAELYSIKEDWKINENSVLKLKNYYTKTELQDFIENNIYTKNQIDSLLWDVGSLLDILNGDE